MHRVDILLPTYNGADYIEAQIDSILSQTHSNIRLIIRDDQSQDQTIALIEKYADNDSRVFIIKENGPNLGLVKSIEYLLNVSEAPFIMFSDQDDVWFPDKVAMFLKKALEINQNIPMLIHSDCFVANQKLKILKRFMGSKAFNYGLKNSLFHFYVQGSSAMINSKLKEESLPFPKNLYLHDRYLHIVSEIKGIRVYIDKPSMLYRQHDKNLVGSHSIVKKVIRNLDWNQKFYLAKDRVLMLSIYGNKYPENELLGIYSSITDDEVNRLKKIILILRNGIPLRIKELILLIFKN
ncbi:MULTISPECIES: glycosyltransferase family 2 protein [unclassified Flavobacterium]|uniref:glycosyltransferase family 2 protein n=1 Tax=unclassified Flavobacterium TaxID=196869 RepID=UPI0025C4014F|nr:MULTISPECIES: glycosyltransferase family 2 protein [unclassified Flavobacterium]